jgi:hypothetical protein
MQEVEIHPRKENALRRKLSHRKKKIPDLRLACPSIWGIRPFDDAAGAGAGSRPEARATNGDQDFWLAVALAGFSFSWQVPA